MLLRSRAWLLPSLLVSGLASIVACSSPGGSATGTSSQAAAGMSVMQMTPTWASSAAFAGRLDPSTSVQVQVHLAMHDAAGAKALLARVSDPDDALYGRFLSDDEFAAKYAPTAEDVATVRAHLESKGLEVTFVPSNNAFLSAEGDAGDVETAFGTQLGQYRVAARRARRR
jgi:subtilase family serine protease